MTANTKKPRAQPTAVNGPSGKLAAAPKPATAHSQVPLFARPASSVAPQASVQRSSAATPQPQATTDPHPMEGSGTADRGGVLPLGAQQDPVLDPTVRSQLQKRIGVHVTLLVTVGEDGHTKHVAFQPPIDPQIEREVEAILADANWDAAVCGGGVDCEGLATIRL